MNDKNFEYLKNLLNNLGFGTRLNYVLEKALRQELTLFTLGVNDYRTPPGSKHLTAPAKDQVRYELNFNKSKSSDATFMGDMKVILHRAGELMPRAHTFDLEKDHRISALQAYKLLSGQSFEKSVLYKPQAEQEQQDQARAGKRNLWFKLNLDITDAYGQHPLSKFPPEYGFDLEKALGKYLIEGLENASIKAQLIKDLRNGNVASDHMRLFDMVIPVYLAANPQFRTIDIYDQHMQPILDQQIFTPQQLAQQKQQQVSPVEQIELGHTENNGIVQQQPWKQELNQDINQAETSQIRR